MATSATTGGPLAHGKQAGEAAYGLCYGTKTSQPLTPAQVVEKYKSRGISKTWLSPTPLSKRNEAVISILKRIITDPDLKSKIKVVMCIDCKDLDLLAEKDKAKQWVDTYITDYASIISHVCVGDVIGSADFPHPTFPDAMSNLEKLLEDPIKLSTFVNKSFLLGEPYTATTHPSTCVLTPRSKEMLLCLSKLMHSPIPLFVRIMPYFVTSSVPVDNCILNDETKPYMYDGDYSYSQAFDAIVDSICCALKKVDGLDKVDIHVASGWPNAGPTDYASEKYAKRYIHNLVRHIGQPTPRGNKPVDIFIYSMVDEENLVTAEEELKHLGAERYLP